MGIALREAKAWVSVIGKPLSRTEELLAALVAEIEAAPVVELPSRRGPALEGGSLVITTRAAERMGMDGQRVRLLPEGEG